MRVMDAILSFPIILLAIGIMAVLGAGFANLMIALGVVYTPRFARLVRSSVLSVREKEYIEAARVTGCGDFAILFVHILPNCWAPVIIQATSPSVTRFSGRRLFPSWAWGPSALSQLG